MIILLKYFHDSLNVVLILANVKCFQFPLTFFLGNCYHSLFRTLPRNKFLRKSTAIFAHVPCDFISLYLFVLTFAMKLKSTNYKRHQYFSIFRPMQNNDVRFEYVPWKNVIHFHCLGSL